MQSTLVKDSSQFEYIKNKINKISKNWKTKVEIFEQKSESTITKQSNNCIGESMNNYLPLGKADEQNLP